MKITKSYLRQIIVEELQKEAFGDVVDKVKGFFKGQNKKPVNPSARQPTAASQELDDNGNPKVKPGDQKFSSFEQALKIAFSKNLKGEIAVALATTGHDELGIPQSGVLPKNISQEGVDELMRMPVGGYSIDTNDFKMDWQMATRFKQEFNRERSARMANSRGARGVY